MIDRTAFVREMTLLAEATRAKLSAAAIEAYYRALGDQSPEMLFRAMAEAAKVCEFMPSPAKILDLIPRVAPPREMRALPPPTDWEFQQSKAREVRELIEKLTSKFTPRGQA